MLIFTMAVLLGSAGQPGADVPAKKGADDEIVCRSHARTGTRFAKKICMKRKVMEEIAEQDRRALEEIQMRPKDNPPETPLGPRN